MARKSKSGPAEVILKVGRCTETKGWYGTVCRATASWVPTTFALRRGPEYVYDNRMGHRWDWRCGVHSPLRGIEARWRADEQQAIDADRRSRQRQRESELHRSREAIIEEARKFARGTGALVDILRATRVYEELLRR